MKNAIKPCPFCGQHKTLEVISGWELMGEEQEFWTHSDSFAVICSAAKPDGKGGCGATGGLMQTEDAAISTWNTRAEQAPQPAPKAEPVNQMLLVALKALLNDVGTANSMLGAVQARAAIAAAEQAPQPAELTDEEILAANYPDGVENGETISRPDYELIAFGRQVLAAQGAKHG